MSNGVSFDVRDGVATIRLTRPESRNPLSVDVLEELDRLIEQVAKHGSLDRVYFTGTNDVFASGANVLEIAALTTETARGFSIRGQNLMNKIAGLKLTTIAVINGYCYGGALDLALACDIRIASPNATFCHPGAGLGIITGWGGTQRLPRLIGPANASMMFFTAAPINADTAHRIGLIDAIVTHLPV